jgi:FkbM family methyltransferase
LQEAHILARRDKLAAAARTAARWELSSPLVNLPTLRAIRGAFGRGRRALRRRMLEPLLVGRPTLRDTVMNALAARGHLIFCDLGDVRFFVDPGDRVVGAWLIWHGGWQRREIEQAVAVLTSAGRALQDSTFVDVGANIGTHTVYALRTGTFTHAVAIEAEPRNARLLRMNLEINKLSEVTTVVEKAAGASSGTAVLHLHPRNKGAHAIGTPPSVDGQESLDVPMVRVDDALADAGVPLDRLGLIWVDVEGYEPEVLRGLGRVVAYRIPIAFEFIPSRFTRSARLDLVDLLSPHYATLHRLSGLADNRAPISAIESIEGIDDILVF